MRCPEPTRLRAREQITGDIDWAVRYFAPWVGKGYDGSPTDTARTQRPLPTVMPKRSADDAGAGSRHSTY